MLSGDKTEIEKKSRKMEVALENCVVNENLEISYLIIENYTSIPAIVNAICYKFLGKARTVLCQEME